MLAHTVIRQTIIIRFVIGAQLIFFSKPPQGIIKLVFK